MDSLRRRKHTPNLRGTHRLLQSSAPAEPGSPNSKQFYIAVLVGNSGQEASSFDFHFPHATQSRVPSYITDTLFLKRMI